MIASKIRIDAQITKIVNLEDELDGLEGEQSILKKRKEIETEEAKLAEIEAAYNGSEVEKPKPWAKKRVEPALFSFC